MARPIGLEPNNLCPHCNRKVRKTMKIDTGYYVEHWWSRVLCKNVADSPMVDILESQFKRHRYTIEEVINEPA